MLSPFSPNETGKSATSECNVYIAVIAPTGAGNYIASTPLIGGAAPLPSS